VEKKKIQIDSSNAYGMMMMGVTIH